MNKMLEQPKLVIKCDSCGSTDIREDGNMMQCKECANQQINPIMFEK